jgi:hypothetical protein
MFIARTNPGNPTSIIGTNLNRTENLSGQADGAQTTFTVSEEYTNLRVYYNGVFNNDSLIGQTSTTFTLDFAPRAGSVLEIVYDKPA